MVVPTSPQRSNGGLVSSVTEPKAAKSIPSAGRGMVQANVSESTSPASVSRHVASTLHGDRDLSPLLERRDGEVDGCISGHPMGRDSSTEDHMKRMGSGSSNIMVAVRTRSLLPFERAQGGREVLRVLENKVVVLMDPGTTASDDYLRLNKSKERRYAFDHVFEANCSQSHVYENTAQFLIPGVLHGFNATVFAYGATGAGKTYTMLGSYTQPGTMTLTLRDLFEHVKALKRRNEKHIQIKCSFLEVYNENIRDLLASSSSDYLDLREDPVKGMSVAGISEVGGLESAQEIMDLLQRGNRNRTTEPTSANETSSRSHAVLQVVVEQREKGSGLVAEVLVGKLSMIDLAGSERASQTNNKGLRMIEGANINRSLLALGNCITALADQAGGKQSSFVPYRDSKLTRLLKDSLGGNCRTVMIANISPCHLNYEDTHNTLKYANRAKKIKTKVTRNVLNVSFHISKYTQIINELRAVVTDLRQKLATKSQTFTPQELMSPTNDPEREASERWRQELVNNVEERVQLKRSLIDTEIEAQTQQTAKAGVMLSISRWEEQAASGAAPTGTDEAPKSIGELQQDLSLIEESISSSEKNRHMLAERLRDNEEVLHALQAKLPNTVHNDDVRAFLELMFRNQVLEVEAMESYEQAQQMLKAHEMIYQIKLRDQMLEEHRLVLTDEQRDQVDGVNSHASYIPLRTGDFTSATRDSDLPHVGNLAASDSSAAEQARELGIPRASKIKGMKDLVDEITKGPITSRQQAEPQSPQYKPPSRAKTPTPTTVKLPHIDHPPSRYKLLSRQHRKAPLASQRRSSRSSLEHTRRPRGLDYQGNASVSKDEPQKGHNRFGKNKAGVYRYRSSVINRNTGLPSTAHAHWRKRPVRGSPTAAVGSARGSPVVYGGKYKALPSPIRHSSSNPLSKIRELAQASVRKGRPSNSPEQPPGQRGAI
ncbi:Kinesin [Perkinsus olseni]|uniref:Kinesin-like protein n=1 Tax=Perkinsus olseni TaxID=32597 RepID=A0A7J6M1Y3_PEROL|nr:Kinesin [Perkinsus olseni]KAF4665436.1 Kinesin [Perkinsus olseni]